MVPEKYRSWQSATNDQNQPIVGQVNEITSYLGDTYDEEPWFDVNSYLPEDKEKISEFKVLSKYSDNSGGIEISFLGEFPSEISYIADQVVFKLSKNNDDLIIAEFKDKDQKKYKFIELSENYRIVSWELTRLRPGRDNVDKESAEVSMKWAWEGNLNGQRASREGELLWKWDPYEK